MEPNETDSKPENIKVKDTPKKKWLYIARVLESCASCVYIKKEIGEWCCYHPNFATHEPFKRFIIGDDKLRQQGNVDVIEIPDWCPLPNKEGE
jgi:hypothetical protein